MTDTTSTTGSVETVTDGTPAPETQPRGPLRLTPLNQPPTAWDSEGEGNKPKKRNKLMQGFVLTAIGLFSFFVFIYLTFPYGVLKEVISTKVTDAIQQSGYPISVRIGELHPYWFTGVELDNVVITNSTDSAATIKLGEVTARVSILPLLIGRLSVASRITQAGGYFEADAKIPILGLLKGAATPRTVEVVMKSFALDGFFNHLLAIPKASRDPSMVLVQPIISKTTLGGKINGKIAFENIDRMTGAISLNLSNFFLHIDDETLKIPQQDFSTAKIDMKYQNSMLIFNDTKLEAPDIGIGLNGSIAFPELPNGVAQANLDMKLSMHGNVEKSLGMIVPNLLRCKPLINGELQAKLQGPLTNMSCL